MIRSVDLDYFTGSFPSSVGMKKKNANNHVIQVMCLQLTHACIKKSHELLGESQYIHELVAALHADSASGEQYCAWSQILALRSSPTMQWWRSLMWGQRLMTKV